jgi:hypothetical protein
MNESGQNMMSTNGEQRQETEILETSCHVISDNFKPLPPNGRNGSREPSTKFSLNNRELAPVDIFTHEISIC